MLTNQPHSNLMHKPPLHLKCMYFTLHKCAGLTTVHLLFTYTPDSEQQGPRDQLSRSHDDKGHFADFFLKKGHDHKVAVFDARSPCRVSLVNH